MGAIGGLLGTAGGNGGTGFSTPSGTNAGQINTSYDQNQNLLNALQGQNGIGNQSQVYGQLQNVASGNGANPAQAMLNQATGQNTNNQAALMAGQRGAAGNVGLMARQAGMAGANIQQQAAGQGATMQANQSLNALQQAGSMANTQAGQQIGATQNEQQILQGANTANNNIQGQLANTTMQGQQGLVGGLMNGLGAVSGVMKATGGPVQALAAGGSAGPQSMFAQYLTAPQAEATPTFSSNNPGAEAMANSMKPGQKKQSSSDIANAAAPQATATFNNMLAGPQMQPQAGPDSFGVPMAAEGGMVDCVLSPQEKVLSPEKAKAVAAGKADPMKSGKTVPGTPKVKADSYSNDVVPAKLPEGSIVLPLSVTQHKILAKKLRDL